MIVKMLFGSHVYGTDTPKSDKDYKGVFIPKARDVLLGRIPHTVSDNTKRGNEKNTADDVDSETYSLHHFIKMCLDNEMVAFDMLHTPGRFILTDSYIWNEIIAYRQKFYTKSLKAYFGYITKQAAKYGVKGSRLHAIKSALVIMDGSDGERLEDVWTQLPIVEHATYNGDFYEICGKKLHRRMKIREASDILHKTDDRYGERARMAESSEGVDWKAMSHAIRVGYQIIELFDYGTITFPRPEATHLKEIKQGLLSFDKVSDELEGLVTIVKALSEKSTFPEKPDYKFWDKWIYETMMVNMEWE